MNLVIVCAPDERMIHATSFWTHFKWVRENTPEAKIEVCDDNVTLAETVRLLRVEHALKGTKDKTAQVQYVIREQVGRIWTLVAFSGFAETKDNGLMAMSFRWKPFIDRVQEAERSFEAVYAFLKMNGVEISMQEILDLVSEQMNEVGFSA